MLVSFVFIVWATIKVLLMIYSHALKVMSPPLNLLRIHWFASSLRNSPRYIYWPYWIVRSLNMKCEIRILKQAALQICWYISYFIHEFQYYWLVLNKCLIKTYKMIKIGPLSRCKFHRGYIFSTRKVQRPDNRSNKRDKIKKTNDYKQI